jgi:hypothetical protein
LVIFCASTVLNENKVIIDMNIITIMLLADLDLLLYDDDIMGIQGIYNS